MSWKSIGSTSVNPSTYRHRESRAKATIQRNEDGSARVEATRGPFGLGRKVGAFLREAPADDSVILSRIESSLFPPKVKQWTPVDGKKTPPGVSQYEGRTGGLISKTVEATITRVGDEALFEASSGLLGTKVQGQYFASAPGDREILSRIARTL